MEWNKFGSRCFGLLEEIRGIIFKFEEQRNPIMAIHKAKSMFYCFRQLGLSNADYLQKFRNLADIATSLGGNLHDNAVSRIVTKKLHDPITDPVDARLSDEQNQNIQDVASEHYLASSFIHHADKNVSEDYKRN